MKFDELSSLTSVSKMIGLWQKKIFRVQTRRLTTSFETFPGSVEHTGP